MPASGPVLVINAGSSSIRFALFGPDLSERLSGHAEGIGTGAPRLHLGSDAQDIPLPHHAAALSAILNALRDHGTAPDNLGAAAHRVVHGGRALIRPVRLTPDIRAQIAACTPLAPLHNPHNLAAIDTLTDLAPDLPQCASFDTAFHATMPEVAARYALPPALDGAGIRRYGFHGISYAALTRHLPDISGAPLPRRLLAFHLGNGASICAIRDGQSVATTMGYSPVEGLTMGTRCGDIDANAVLQLAEEDGIDATRRLLNRESGLRGLSGGLSDMRALLASDAPEAAFAVDHFCHSAIRHAGSLIAAMGGCDAIAFTGGIGEHAAPVRARIMAGLEWLGLRARIAANEAARPRLHDSGSAITAWIVPAQEERQIAADALALLTQG
ncbi:acetate kinase [Salinihabitans flavidus]|uniref:Acetate kinase n=1 Tax=Salinihabitans flavidus TaxID=569882 RepID=A0A1H8MUU5_9RHOB|nr:acetate/propionate family kinase [Salinihabitans flavidus]SEO21014.1 acetate kinase [Salinihabitans flavidus]